MRNTITRISLFVAASSLFILAVIYVIGGNLNGRPSNISDGSHSSARTSTKFSDVPGMPVVPINAVPTFGGYPWRIASTSNVELARCFTRERIEFAGLHTLAYMNDIPGALASVSWITGVVAPPDYFTSAVQHCVAGVTHPRNLTELTPGDSVTSPASETIATDGSLTSYATAASFDGMMLLTFWTQPGAPTISPSPANAMGFRAEALYKLASMGVHNPEVVNCPIVSERPTATVPHEVRAIIESRYVKLKPLVILDQYSNSIDVRAESVTPHVCVYSDGRQVAYTGKVPVDATEAIQVDVKHAPSPPTGSVETFVTVAKIPTKGWIIVDEWG